MAEEEATTSKGPAESKEEQQDKSKGDEKVAFHKLFSFADGTDVVLMIVGTIGAIGNGLALPLMTVFFGEMIDSFGSNQANTDIVDVVSKVNFSKLFLFSLLSI